MLSTQLDTSNSVGLTQSKSEFKGTDKQFHGNQNDTISRESPLEQLKHELIGRPIDYGNPEGSDQLSFIKRYHYLINLSAIVFAIQFCDVPRSQNMKCSLNCCDSDVHRHRVSFIFF